MEVVERHDLVRVDEAPSRRRGDEARTARDEDPLAGKRHGGSLAAYPA
jgi:hypothetical protein